MLSVLKYLATSSFFLLMGSTLSTNVTPATDWAEYNGDAAKSHYSPLSQISTTTVQNLKVAWTYSSGGADTVSNRTQIQCNPIIINGVLYGVSADTQVFALDAKTGKQRWKTQISDNGGTTSRGVTYWSDGNEKRIFWGSGPMALCLRS